VKVHLTELVLNCRSLVLLLLLLLSLLLAILLRNVRHIFKPLLTVVLRYLYVFICVTVLRLACASF